MRPPASGHYRRKHRNSAAVPTCTVETANALCYSVFQPMNIKKQRLLTPGPTPLYPKALYAMLGSDLHHRTDDFRNVYKSVLADLKELMGTANDVLVLVSSGTGAMEASVTNCFSAGDRVIVCTAGKFGERWAEITKAYGLNVL